VEDGAAGRSRSDQESSGVETAVEDRQPEEERIVDQRTTPWTEDRWRCHRDTLHGIFGDDGVDVPWRPRKDRAALGVPLAKQPLFCP
jgi:hypothetical protein